MFKALAEINRYRKIDEKLKRRISNFVGFEKVMIKERKLEVRKLRIFKLLVIVQAYSAYSVL